jgi:hypothetical protein
MCIHISYKGYTIQILYNVTQNLRIGKVLAGECVQGVCKNVKYHVLHQTMIYVNLNSYRTKLSLAEVLIISLTLFQPLLMLLLTINFSKAANFFQILICFCFLNSSSCNFKIKSNPHKSLCCFFTYCQSFPKFCNQQIVISVKFSPLKIRTSSIL